MTAASRVIPARCRVFSIRAVSGAIFSSSNWRELGRVKNPSVRIAVVPSSSSKVETPRKVARSSGPLLALVSVLSELKALMSGRLLRP